MTVPLITTADLTEKLPRKTVLWRALAVGLTTGVAVFLITWLSLAWPTVVQTVRWQLGVRPTAPASLTTTEAGPSIPADRLVIPAIGVDAPVFWDTPVTDAVGRLPDGVVHVGGTALPGAIGNSFLIGHSAGYWWQRGEFNQVFALLDRLNVGDRILVNHSSTTFQYLVVSQRVINPTQVEVLSQPTDQTLLTLMTCTPVGTTRNRLLVEARLISS